jgi:hypothetical protein
MFRRRKNRPGPPQWSRLPHEDLGMSAPAVYLPQRSLPADIRGMWGFEPILTRDAGKQIPYAHNAGSVLAADIRSRDGMDLLILPAAPFTGTGEPAVITEPQLLASGRFADLHPPEWKEAAYAAQSMLAVIGPDDLPAIDPEKLREGVRAALGSLWIFNAAVAALYLVMPDAASR